MTEFMWVFIAFAITILAAFGGWVISSMGSEIDEPLTGWKPPADDFEWLLDEASRESYFQKLAQEGNSPHSHWGKL